MTLLEPYWLLLALPLAAALWLWPLPSRTLNVMRIVMSTLLLLGLAQLAITYSSRAGHVIVVADRSRSVPGDALSSYMETIGLVHRSMGPHDRLGVVSFGETVAVEQVPTQAAFPAFVTNVGSEASDVYAGIELAMSLVPAGSPGRILLLSDGEWTGRDPAEVATIAAARGIAVDYRHRARPTTGDLAIASVDAPSIVQPREGFLMTAWVQSPYPQTVQYQVLRNNELISSGQRSVRAGLSALTIRDQFQFPTTHTYTISVTGSEPDPVPGNNTARVIVGAEGPRPAALVTRNPAGGLANILAAGGLDTVVRDPEEMRWTLDELSGYSAVILEEVPANMIGGRGMENLAQWVRHTGSGLLMTGGRNGYGPGGYHQSPIEPILPVTMELRQEHRKHSLAIVIAMDRSGSMAMPVGGGRAKMDLANLAAVQVLDMMSPQDEIGVLAVDTAAHTIVPLTRVGEASGARQRVLQIDSRGGGIYVFEALTRAAAMLANAEAQTRHIVLFADAADAEQPGEYVELLRRCVAAGITCSVIGLGTEQDPDADFLKDVALRGEGRIFFTDRAEELPRLFAQDMFVVARSSFIEDITPWQITPGLITVLGEPLRQPPEVAGYNLTYARDQANIAGVTGDEYRAPMLATWFADTGRVACYTGQVDGPFTGPVVQWEDFGNFWTGLSRWVIGEQPPLPGGMAVTQRVDEGYCHVVLHLDPEREVPGLSGTPSVTALRGLPGMPPVDESFRMTWIDADHLAVAIPLRGNEILLNTVDIPDAPPFSLPPVSMLYSPEYQPTSDERGEPSLRAMANITGGVVRPSPQNIWADLPPTRRIVSLRPWLLLAACVFLLVEVLERRTGGIGLARAWLARALGRRRRPPEALPGTTAATRPAEPRRRRLLPRRRAARSRPDVETASTEPTSAAASAPTSDSLPAASSTSSIKQPSADESNIKDALSRARQRAQRRTRN